MLGEGSLLREAGEEPETTLLVAPPPLPLPQSGFGRARRRLVVKRPSAEETPVARAAAAPPAGLPENLCERHRQVQSQADMEHAFS